MDVFMEIFTLVTGVIYVVLEIRQKNFMWIVGMVNALAAMYMFFSKNLYASFGVNTYYFAIAFWGLYQWRRDARRLKAGLEVSGKMEGAVSDKSDAIHLNRLGWKTLAGCAVAFCLGLAVLRFAIAGLGDPMSGLDAGVAVLSAVATYMLGRSYREQWLLWIVADILSALLCVSQGMYWMMAMYAVYTASAAYGYFYWGKYGVYVDESGDVGRQ